MKRPSFWPILASILVATVVFGVLGLLQSVRYSVVECEETLACVVLDRFTGDINVVLTDLGERILRQRQDSVAAVVRARPSSPAISEEEARDFLRQLSPIP